ncbi:aminodeoxychorismate/anthranilate synthase component II [Adhaeribacter aquaticus]|uniref:anthranilate synthase component II n=1 Tax=Adhaeribacter aquaticus TaxID=299567 RepID=UPI00040D0BA9
MDNFDSYTYNLLDYFGQLGIESTVIRNDVPLNELDQIAFDAIVLSPGPGTPATAGNLMAVIDRYHQSKPILGICLGHQAIGQYFGASVTKGLRPMHGKISEIFCTKDAIFENLPLQMPVVRYHSLVLKEVPEVLLPLAYTAEQELMAFRHQKLPLYALQFHPEAILTTYGLDILRNWAILTGMVVK